MPPRLDGVARVYPDQRDWGPGWPDCQRDRFVSIEVDRVRLKVRQEVADLVRFLLSRTGRLGYEIRPTGEPCGGTWGARCRKIKRSDPPAPSWHSWGLAVDINAPCNPMSSRWRCTLPPDVVEMWESAGFYWGGRYDEVHDTMHFEYLGSPADVASDLRRARRAYRRLKPRGDAASDADQDG